MSIYNSSFVNSQLSKQTSIFGLRLWVVIGVFLGSLVVLALFLLSICLTARRRRRRNLSKEKPSLTKHHHFANFSPNLTPPTSKEIQEVVVVARYGDVRAEAAEKAGHSRGEVNRPLSNHGNSGGGGGIGNVASAAGSGNNSCGNSGRVVEVSHLGWGRWYTLREVEEATGGFCPENVIGDGGYGIVYSGVLGDGTKVAVKNLLNTR